MLLLLLVLHLDCSYSLFLLLLTYYYYYVIFTITFLLPLLGPNNFHFLTGQHSSYRFFCISIPFYYSHDAARSNCLRLSKVLMLVD